jgi:hypothetical protein
MARGMAVGAGVAWLKLCVLPETWFFVPTLTGLGERAHLLRPGLTIEDFPNDPSARLLHHVMVCAKPESASPIKETWSRPPSRNRGHRSEAVKRSSFRFLRVVVSNSA